MMANSFYRLCSRSRTQLLLAVVAIVFSVSGHSKTYTVGVESANLFPHYDFSNGEPRGYLVEVINKFAKAQDFKIDFKVMEVNELWRAYTNGELDFRLPDNLLWQRDIKADLSITYSAPIAYFTDGVVSLFANKDKPITRLGTINGFTAWGYQGDIESGEIELVTVNSLQSLIAGLYSGRFDGAYYNVEAFTRLVEEAGYPPTTVAFRRNLVKTRSLYMLSSIQHGKLVKELNQFLRTNKTWVRERKAHYGLK